MKRVRITYQGAFHHGMNRGINGEDIFSGNRNKAQFLVRLKDLGGLKYVEINDIPSFDNLKFASLPKLYKDAKQRLRKDKETKS